MGRLRRSVSTRLVPVVVATALVGTLVGVATSAVEGIGDAPPASATVPGGLGYTPLATPCRAVDTRTTATTTIGPDVTRNFQIGGTGSLVSQGGPAGGCAVPESATAAEITVTVVSPVGTGFLRVFPSGPTVPNATFVNYTSGRGITNTGTVPLTNASVQDLGVKNFGGTIQLVIDVQGYHSASVAGGFVALGTPCKAVDTRTAGGRLTDPGGGTGASRAFQLAGGGSLAAQGGPAGGCGVPNGVPAVEVSLTVIDPTTAGGFTRLLPNGSSATTAFVNYTPGTGITNTGTVGLSNAVTQDVVVRNFGGSVHVRIDVIGYFSAEPVGTRYQTVTPCRTVDTRNAGGAMTAGTSRTFQTGGNYVRFISQGAADPVGCGIPQRAVAVEAALTAISPSGSGFTQPGRAGSTPSATFLNYTGVGGITNVGTIPIAVGGTDDLVLSNSGGSADYAVDVLGYFEPASVPANTVEDIATGGDGHTCAVLANRTVRCWGDNLYKQLGPTVNAPPAVPPVLVASPVPIAGITDAVQVVTGRGHACALRATGTVLCWGLNDSAQLGFAPGGGTDTTFTPTSVPGVSFVVQLAAGDAHTCALLLNGTVRCWGANGSGQLGNGTTAASTSSVVVTGVGDARQITAGLSHSCAIRANGTAVCWGSRFFGQVGDGTSGATPRTSATAVASATGMTRISAGGDTTCAILANASTRCWGLNANGQFANDSLETINTTPTPSLYPGAVQVSTGRFSSCVTLADGGARCSGDALLGNGTANGARTPQVVSGASQFSQVSTGRIHTCATRSDGSARCWGENGIGSLGDATVITPRLTPVAVVTLP